MKIHLHLGCIVIHAYDVIEDLMFVRDVKCTNAHIVHAKMLLEYIKRDA